MKNIVKISFLILASLLFISCGGNTSNSNKGEVYTIGYYKKVYKGFSIGEEFTNFYKDDNTKKDYFVNLKNLDYQIGYEYKVRGIKNTYEDNTELNVLEVLEKKFTPQPFNTLHKLKYFRAKYLNDNKYKILNKLNVKVLDDNLKDEFDSIIKRSTTLGYQSENDEKIRLYFEFDYDEESETINFIKLVKIDKE